MRIRDEYEITADRNNFILRQRLDSTDKAGNPKDKFRETYYATLTQACECVLAREVSKSIEGSCQQVIVAVAHAQAAICASIAAAEELPVKRAA